MNDILEASSKFHDRLLASYSTTSAEEQSLVGWITGIQHSTSEEKIVLLSTIKILADKTDGESLKADAEEVKDILPGGICIVGAVVRGPDQSTLTDDLVRSVSQALKSSRQAPQCDIRLVIGLLGPSKLTWFKWREGSLHLVDLVSLHKGHPGEAPVSQGGLTAGLDPWLASEMVPLRCQLSVPLEVVGGRPTASAAPSTGKSLLPMGKAIDAAFRDVTDRLCRPSGSLPDLLASPLPSAASSGEVLLPSNEEEVDFVRMGAGALDPVSLTLLQASPPGPPGARCPAPCCQYLPLQGGPASMDHASLQVDVLCYVPRGPVQGCHVGGLVRQGLVNQLESMQRLLMARGGPVSVRALHFHPPGVPHPVTALYPLPPDHFPPEVEEEEELKKLRERLHKRLGLPLNRPALRVGQALAFGEKESKAKAGGPLPDVHLGLGPSGVTGGTVHLIDGSYDYFHYMQDRMDDNGWGCAYRSLQTICSWFRKQHYTQAPIPSHKEIQQMLVSIGDKETTFVGSREWIGAIELGYVLDTHMGVTSKIITVPSGADMPTKAREIALHFDTQGTPIMIGGGVLAYTLLGIDLNEATGECAFLILDPHYTGADNLSRVQAGQWVAWKLPDGKAAAGGDLFVRTAFYNLLCPQRPNTL